MSLLGGKFEFTPFKVALRETVEWLVDHYDTDARIGLRSHGNNGVHNGVANEHKLNGTVANGHKLNETAAYVERAEVVETDSD